MLALPGLTDLGSNMLSFIIKLYLAHYSEERRDVVSLYCVTVMRTSSRSSR